MPYLSTEEAWQMGQEVELEEQRLQSAMLAADPAWLRLPIAKKKIGIERLRVMLEYDRAEGRTKSEAQAAADKVGVRLRSFYALLKQWRDANRSPFVLIPYASEGGTRRSRLPEGVADKLQDFAKQQVADLPAAPTSELITRLKSAWGNEPALPSDVTIRSFIDRARGDHRPAPGTITAEALGFNKQSKSRGFGDVLIIDHSAPADMLIQTHKGSVPPTFTLVIDEFTGTPVGASVSKHSPSGDSVVAAIANARDFIARLVPEAEVSGATIVFASTYDRTWRGLSEDLIASGYRVNEVTEGTLTVGHVIKQIIGSRLDDIPLQSSRALRKAPEVGIDPERKTLLKLNGFRRIVEDAVEKVFRERLDSDNIILPPDDEYEPRPVSLKAELRGFSTFGSNPEELEPPEGAAALERAQKVFLDLRAKQAKSGRVARPNASRTFRSPGIFHRRLERLAHEISGPSLVSAEVIPPQSGQPAWALVVTVNDPTMRTPVWLELAREAISLADLELTLVQVTVDVVASDDQ